MHILRWFYATGAILKVSNKIDSHLGHSVNWFYMVNYLKYFTGEKNWVWHLLKPLVAR